MPTSRLTVFFLKFTSTRSHPFYNIVEKIRLFLPRLRDHIGGCGVLYQIPERHIPIVMPWSAPPRFIEATNATEKGHSPTRAMQYS